MCVCVCVGVCVGVCVRIRCRETVLVWSVLFLLFCCSVCYLIVVAGVFSMFVYYYLFTR